MRRRIACLWAVVVVASMSCLPIAVASPAAAEENLGELTFYPGKGRDTDPMFLITSRPCPAQTKSVRASIFGRGFPAEGQLVVATTAAGFSVTDRFFEPFQDTLNGFASLYGIKLGGKYSVVLRCQDRLGATTFGTFTGTITFSEPTRYTAAETVLIQPSPELNPTTTPSAAVVPSPTVSNQPSPPSGDLAASASPSSSAAAGASGETQSPAPTGAPGESSSSALAPSAIDTVRPDANAADPEASSTRRPEDPSTRWILLGLGALLVLLGGGWALRGKAAQQVAEPTVERKVKESV